MKVTSNKKGAKIILSIIVLVLLFLSFLILIKSQTPKPGPRPNNNESSQSDDNLNNKPDKEPEQEPHQEPSPAEKLLSQMTLEEKVGQMLIVGFTGIEPDYYIDRMISKRNIGGVILMKHNILNREQLIALTNSLQLKSADTNLKIPLFIATDQEGGEIVRIRVTGVSEFSAQSSIKNKEQAFKVALNRGKELADIGVNTNFSPVLDYISDEKSFLYSRTFQESPSKTSELGSAMVEGYQEHIISSPKHFLGHSDTVTDPHSSLVISNFSLEDIEERINIFKSVNKEASPAMLMTSHISYTNIDAQHPCSLSKKCISEYLKNDAKLSPDTVIITDAMEMGAIANNYSTSEAAIMAINAGNDILLYTRNPETQAEAYEAVVAAVENSKISISQIDDSVLKILNLKMRYLY